VSWFSNPNFLEECDVSSVSSQAPLKQLKPRYLQVGKGGLPPLKIPNFQLSWHGRIEVAATELERG